MNPKVANSEIAEKFLADYLTPNNLGIETVRAYCEAGKAVFLFDGLDELEPGVRELIVNALADFRIKHRKCKMVLSGRLHGMDTTVLNRFGKKRAKINTLSNEQIENFITKWLGV